MKLTDFIKQLYGDKDTMTLAELTQAANAMDSAKFVDLREGGYVDEGRYSDVSAKLTRANQTIRTLQTPVAEFEGVDVAELQRQLNQEKSDRKKDKQEWNLKAALSGAGCKDTDYVMWKLGQSVEFAEDGNIKDVDSLIENCKTNFASQFDAPKEERQESHAQTGVRLTSGGDHGSGGSPDYDSMSDEEYYSAVLKSK